MKSGFTIALALVAGVANAASSSCSFSSTTITASASLSQVASCATISGTVEISGNEISSLDLSSVEEIAGTVNIFNSSSITAVNLPDLESITGSLSLDALTQLFSVDFTKLTEVNELTLISLPSLSTLNLNAGIDNATLIELSDTALSTLDGFVSSLSTIGTLNVNNNKNITTIELTNLETVTTGLILSFNSDNCSIDLSQLQWASNFTIQDVGLLTVTNLTAVNGTFNVGYNSFNSVEFEALEEVGGDLQFFANDEVTEIDFPVLATIGGELLYFNNTNLENITDSFHDLEKIKGAVNIAGGFGNFTLPSLELVNGDFNVSSTNDDFSCDDFDKLHKDGKIEGHNYECSSPSSSTSASQSGSLKETGSSSSSSSGSSSTGSSSSTKSSQAGGLMASHYLSFAALFGALSAFLL